jgi:hypothetical protein
MNNAEVKEQLALAARLSTSRNIRTLATVCRALLDRVEALEAQVAAGAPAAGQAPQGDAGGAQ